jgi:DNA repair exonuclease SbcCD ATPase subunit
MGKMYTLKPDESINDHMKESITMLNKLAESIGADYYLNSTLIKDIKPDSVRFVIEHVRNTIEMLDELTDELEDHESEVRREYEEKVVQFFSTWTNFDVSEIQKLNEDLEHFRELAISRNKELQQECEKSNQLEAQVKELKDERQELLSQMLELTGKVHNQEHQLKEEHERYMKLREVKEQSPAYWKAKFERMQKKYSQLDKYCGELEIEIDFLRSEDTDSEDTDSVEVNNPANFCGNCKYFAFIAKEDGMHGCCHERYLKEVDPDDASCRAFESNKPDHEVCDNCDKECGNCGYYPF